MRDYPLVAYLELADLERRLPGAPAAEIDGFLARYPDQLPAERLRTRWLAELAAQRRWADYLRHELASPPGNERRCRKTWALLQTGAQVAADAETEALWLQPDSLPKDCDRVLAAWSARGLPDAERAWKRFHLAMGAGHVGLANYLLRFMDAPHRADAGLYLRLHARPDGVRSTGQFVAGNPRHAEAAAHALARLAGTDPEGARRVFEQLARDGVLDAAAMRTAAPRLANALAGRSSPQAARWIQGLAPEARAPELAEDGVRYALRGGEFDDVDAALDLLPAELAGEERWRYWSARVAQARDPAESATWRAGYDQVSRKRSYYGFLAADRLGAAYAMEHQPVTADAARLAALASHPGIRRARELELIGETWESRREWAYTIERLDKPARETAARLAADWGWHTLAITTLARAEAWNDLELRFPIRFEPQFEAAAASQRVEPTWLFAIARQESAFNEHARSPVGALGLMQVMPATAEHTARKSGLRYRGSAALLNPATNVDIGSRYMRMMLDDFQQNRILAAAAYNAGPLNVRRWLKRLPPRIEHDLFVETIPFRETRKYVQNVLEFQVVYAYLKGRSVPLIQPAEMLISNPSGAG
jgi:soluble lytic murein transglycosylase